MGQPLTLEAVESLPEGKVYLGVLGYPIDHSLSPVFHNAALRQLSQQLKRFQSWEYLKIEVPPEDLFRALEMLPRKGFAGVNLTIPHKVDVLSRIDRFEGVAKKAGAVNTVIFEPGEIVGCNTDGIGMEQAIQMRLNIGLKGRTILMIGAGGASRGACVQCLEADCEQLFIANRSADRLNALLEDLKALYPHKAINGLLFEEPWPGFDFETLVVNATALGLKPEDPLPVELGLLNEVGFLYDMVYHPGETHLVRTARAHEVVAADGLAMLVLQGAAALQRWTGTDIPVDIMFESVQNL